MENLLYEKDFKRNPCLNMKPNQKAKTESDSAILKSPCSHPKSSKGAEYFKRKRPLKSDELKERYENEKDKTSNDFI